LANLGDDYSVIPWLGTSWTHTPDGLHWTVHVRRGVTWSDGAPFSAHDVAFTWKLNLDPKVGFLYIGQFDYIKDCIALDDDTVRFDLSHTNALFESQALNSPILPEHILGKLTPAEQRTSTFGEHPIGTGPYTLASWQHDEEAVFARNPHWWHGAVTIPKLDFRILLDGQARVEAMRTGAADLLDGLGSADYLSLQEQAPWLKFIHLPNLYSYFIFVNFEVKPLADAAVRKAMIYGWDREAVARGLSQGDLVVADGLVPVSLKKWHTSEGVQQYPYDPAKARALLDAAGWKPGADGVRVRNGERLSFELICPTGSVGTTEQLAEFQADMRAIGIEVSIRLLDYATFIHQTNERKYQMAYSGWGGVSDPDQFSLLAADQVPPNGNNIMGYANPGVTRDVTLGLQTVDPRRRYQYYADMQRRLGDDPPVIFAFDSYFRAAYTPRLHFPHPEKILPDLQLWRDVYDWRLDPQ
jgi:peptide/nickel transport system substrate-binding protein